MSLDDKEFDHVKLRVKFKTMLNVVWGRPLENDKRKALAYAGGFPATFYMTDRRCFVVGTFVEKRGLLKKKTFNTIYFEAGLEYIDKAELSITEKMRSGFISFKPHGMIEDGIVHFIRLDPEMSKNIQEVVENAKHLKRSREDTGIVKLGVNPNKILKKRLLE